MKPLTKYLVAGSLSPLVFLACNERFNFTSRLDTNIFSNQLERKISKRTQAFAIAGSRKETRVAVMLYANTMRTAKGVKKDNIPGIARSAKIKSKDYFAGQCNKSSADLAETDFQNSEIINSGEEAKRTGGCAYHSLVSDKSHTGKPVYNAKDNTDTSVFASMKQTDIGTDSYSYTSISNETEALREFALRNGNNKDYALVVNLGIKSGKKRFFVVDLSTGTIVKYGIVAEAGNDVTKTPDQRKLEHKMGGSFVSPGMFSIGQHATKSSYQLYELLKTNGIHKRSMLLQAAAEVPDDEISFPTLKTGSGLSLSGNFFTEISALLDNSEKPVLLWLYDESAQNQHMYASGTKN